MVNIEIFQAFAKSGIVDPDIQNILIVITDTEWDLKGLKDTRGALAKEEVIIQNTRNSFNRIFALSGSQMDPLVSQRYLELDLTAVHFSLPL